MSLSVYCRLNNVTWFNIVTKEYMETILNKVNQAKLAVCATWNETPRPKNKPLGKKRIPQTYVLAG